MELLESKITAIIVLIVGSMLAGLLPAWLSSFGRRTYPTLLSSLLCFGGGVLLATSLVHMLPEIRESLPDYKEYTEVMFCAGFFILYIIDELTDLCFSHHHEQNEPIRTEGSYGAIHSESEPLMHQTRYRPHFIEEAASYDSREVVIENRTNNVGALGLLIALSIHSILEGLAVGLEKSPTQVMLLLGAIATHKIVMAFCLGIELTTAVNCTALRHFISIVIFSCGSAIGIAIGMFVSNIETQDIMQYLLPILQCLAGGTLLYVSVSEVLPRERSKVIQHQLPKFSGTAQCISVIIGFVTMTSLTFYMEH